MKNISFQIKGKQLLNKFGKKFFGHGPYNPLNYKTKLVPENRVSTEEEYLHSKKMTEFGNLPMYSMRHVHPIRQSGPIPPFSGTWTMEDCRRAGHNVNAGWEKVQESTSIDELMRRVPGLTKKEALKIQSLGFTPICELDYAYIVVNNGIDVFFDPTSSYIARQVVTNSKGEKVECLFPTNEPDEFTYTTFGDFIGNERPDHAWDPVPGEGPVSPVPDYELGVPASYFEYEIDNRLHITMTYDQQFIPENERPCPVPKNPNCSSEYWKPQIDLEKEHEMDNSNWVPNTNQNVYNIKGHKSVKNLYDEDGRI